jgi:possible type I restriction-modification system, S subunit
MAGTLKDSKTRWLGQIPTDWDMVRVKDCFDRKNKKANQKNPIVLSLTRSGVKIRDITSNEGQLAADYTNYNPVAKDDILINPMDLVSGDNCNISKVEGVISPAYVNLRYKKGINPRFYNYYFKLQYWLGAFFAHGYGVSFDNRWTLSYEALSKYPIVLPPSEEQDKIADFLDEKCAEIDKLSEDIQKQIDILNDYKKSVITRAVTKGLDPNAEMKDGRVDWAKNIPKTWKVTKLKYLFDFGKGLNITKADLVPEGLPVVSYGQIHSKLNDKTSLSEELLRFVDNRYQVRYPQCRIKQGDFVFADTSEDYEGCGNCVYKRDNSKVFAGYHSIILKAKQNSDNRYLAYLFTTDLWRKQIRTAVSGVKVFSITQNILSRASVILPPEKEKLIIADYLDGVCSDIEYSISAKYSQLENLTIYKKSIIYEYVTGKKRVKGAL